MFMERVYKFIMQLRNPYYETIAVFSHEQFISAVIWMLTVKRGKVPPTSQTMREFRGFLDKHHIPNGAIAEFTFHPGQNTWSYELITAHLEAPEQEMVKNEHLPAQPQAPVVEEVEETEIYQEQQSMRSVRTENKPRAKSLLVVY